MTKEKDLPKEQITPEEFLKEYKEGFKKDNLLPFLFDNPEARQQFFMYIRDFSKARDMMGTNVYLACKETNYNEEALIELFTDYAIHNSKNAKIIIRGNEHLKEYAENFKHAALMYDNCTELFKALKLEFLFVNLLAHFYLTAKQEGFYCGRAGSMDTEIHFCPCCGEVQDPNEPHQGNNTKNH